MGATLEKNEQHEFIEVVYNSSLDVTGYQIIPYRGDALIPYSNVQVINLVDNVTNITVRGAYTFAVYSHIRLRDAVGEGSARTDGIVLFGPDNTLVEFLSYGAAGPFRIRYSNDTNGVAMSTHVVNATGGYILETKSTPDNYSIQRSGTGCDPSDFVWLESTNATPGRPNVGQSFNCSWTL